MKKESKTIAVVEYRGERTENPVDVLSQPEESTLEWKSVPQVHMLGRNTPDERLAYDYLLGRTERGPGHYPDGILALIDGTDLERQLYLVSQLIDLRLPTVLILKNKKEAEKKGIVIHEDKLSTQLGIGVIAAEGHSIAELVFAVESAVHEQLGSMSHKKPIHWRPSTGLADAYNHLDKKWIFDHLKLHTGARLLEGLRLLSVARAVEEYSDHPAYDDLLEHVEEARSMLTRKEENWGMAEVLQRHTWIRQVVSLSTSRRPMPVPEESTFLKKMWLAFQPGKSR